jgi:hypothetical protein
LLSNERCGPGAFPGTKTYEAEAIAGEPFEIMMLVAKSLGKLIPVESLEGVAILSHMGRKVWRKKE